ncbi:splicing factor 3B subunit 6-like [Sorex araneus]|uniref:splicing factor 3B subunit 6-like n=1 Tax=Sorex araneus TaxID=42254 RepID=UPI0024338009|nr:splicing factor 3B subunit 6-like [Sorex araneus]
MVLFRAATGAAHPRPATTHHKQHGRPARTLCHNDNDGNGYEKRPGSLIRLPPEVNRILYIRNLPYKITAEEMYDIFGKYGPIRQIRVGNTPETRGTAYVVYEDIFDAKNACDHLSGFNVCNRYLVVLYYNANRAFQKMDTKKKEEQLKLLKEKYGINTDPPK